MIKKPKENRAMKEQLIVRIIELLNECNDIPLLDLIVKLLFKSK